MTASSLLLFIAMSIVLDFTPGPAVMLVVSQAMRHGFTAGMKSALGILTANTTYFILSAAGLGAILLASRRTFEVVRWGGAAYLVYLGIRMLLSRARKDEEVPATVKPRSYVNGLITQFANPKAIVFFTALLPQFIDPHGNLPRQFFIIGIISIVIEFPVLMTYSFLGDRGRKLASHMHWIERCAGALLVAAGLKLAAARA